MTAVSWLKPVLLACLCGQLPTGATQDKSSDANSSGMYDPAQIQAWVNQIAPSLETWSGRSFKHVPEVRIVSRDDMENLLVRDVDRLRNLRAEGEGADEEVDPDRMIELRRKTSKAAAGLMGKYSIADKVIAIASETIDAVRRRHSWPESQMPAIMKLILAHELAHALQDQEVDLQTTMAALPLEKDIMLAYPAIMEGFAILAHRHVARDLQLIDASDHLDEAIATAHTVGTPPAFCVAFARAKLEQGGMNSLWDSLAHPPRSLGREFREFVAAQRTPSTANNFTRALDLVEETWGLDCAQVTRVDAPAERGMHFFAPLGEDRSNQIKEAIDHIYTCVCRHRAEQHERRLCSVTIYALKDPSRAATLLEAFPPVIEKLKELHSFGGAGRDGGYHEKRLILGKGLAIEVRSLKTHYDGAISLDQMVVWGEISGSIVQVMTINAPLSDAEVITIIQAISVTLQE